MAEVVMPRLSDTMEQGTVAKWLKRPGDKVTKGEPLVEIETDKANMVLDAYETGVLERIIVSEGQTVPIGEPIAHIGAERAVGQAPAAAPAPAPAREAAPQEVAPPPAPGKSAAQEAPPAAAPPSPAPEVSERIKASPIARRIAEEHGIDLSRVEGTGPGGRITKEDVERVLAEKEQPPPAPAARAEAPLPAPPPAAIPPAAAPAVEVELKPLTRMQATIARRMAESKATAPHFYVTTEIGMDAVAELREGLNATLEEGVKIGYNDLLVKAAALALRRFPEVNASYRDGQLEYHGRVNIGIAVALPQGLIVPVLRDTDRKSVLEIARAGQELIEKARTNRLAPADWEGGTFTVSNLGMYDVDEFAAIISPPESAILAVGSIRPTPVVAGDQIKIARRMKATLSADHRVFYGATAAEFLREVKRLLENPMRLLV